MITGRDAGDEVRKCEENRVGLRERSWATSLMAQDPKILKRCTGFKPTNYDTRGQAITYFEELPESVLLVDETSVEPFSAFIFVADTSVDSVVGSEGF